MNDPLIESAKEIEALRTQVEFWKADSAAAWDKCEERRLETVALTQERNHWMDSYNRDAMTKQLAASQAREKVLREALEKVNAAYDEVSDGLQSDLENGVKWLNQQAAQKFNKEYPGVVNALEALLDASILADAALTTPDDSSALDAALKADANKWADMAMAHGCTYMVTKIRSMK